MDLREWATKLRLGCLVMTALFVIAISAAALHTHACHDGSGSCSSIVSVTATDFGQTGQDCRICLTASTMTGLESFQQIEIDLGQMITSSPVPSEVLPEKGYSGLTSGRSPPTNLV